MNNVLNKNTPINLFLFLSPAAWLLMFDKLMFDKLISHLQSFALSILFETDCTINSMHSLSGSQVS